MKEKIILVGGGGHCHSVIDVIEQENKYEIIGIVDIKENIGKKVLDYKIIACDDDLEELFKTEKPFAMLLGCAGIFESQKRFEMFRDNKFEIMYMNRRVSYFKDYVDLKPALNPPFSSVYLCSGMLPQQIMFETINK